MDNYSLIESALFRIEQGRFQKVCAYFLADKYPGEQDSPGGMEDKDKTRPGRPDIYITLENGKFVLAEVTTHDDLDAAGYAKKLRKDLEGCLQFESLGITAADVSAIVLCTNGTVPPALRKELSERANAAGIPLRIFSFNPLVAFFYHTGKLFARDYLGVPFVTGQVLGKAEFLRQYGRSSVATPLDNDLYGRQKELDLLLPLLRLHEVILVSGKPGVGKSRLSLAVIDLFLAENPEYTAYYILTKPEAITEDLLTFIKPGNQYLIFIDDANRQLESLVPVLARANDSGIHIKMILTVRDYAKKEVEHYLRDRHFKGVIVPALDNDILQNILYNDPFQITEAAIRSRILAVANGNARLALMAVKVLQEHQDPELLRDASAIYDGYFKSILTDRGILDDPDFIKVLGVLSFFQTLDTDEEETLDILTDFNIAIDTFHRCIHVLEGMELVEIRFNTVAKIADQVLGTYFFYMTFIKRQLLSAEKLVNGYFRNYIWRIRDTFLPAILAFGELNVLGTSPQFLLSYLDKIQLDYHAQVLFYEIFEIYLPRQVFLFIDQIIKNTPDNDTPFEFGNRYKQSQPTSYDDALRLLEPFYKGEHKFFLTAIGLAIQYVNKHRILLDDLVHQLKNNLFAGGEELSNNFRKINSLYDYLLPKLEQGLAFRVLFYYGLQHALLNTSFNYELYEHSDEGSRFKPSFAALRIRFWNDISLHFERDRELCYDLLVDYLETHGQGNYIYLEADQPLLIALINRNLEPAKFDDTFFVQEYINVLIDKQVPIQAEMKKIQRRFRNKDYTVIRSLSLDRDRRRRLFLSHKSLSDTWEAQVRQVKESFSVTSVAEFDLIQETIRRYFNFKYRYKLEISTGFYLLIEKIFEDNIDMGFNVLDHYLKAGNIVHFNPIRLFNSIFNLDACNAETLYQLISANEFQEKARWLENFFEFLRTEMINDLMFVRMGDHFRNSRPNFELTISYFTQYEVLRAGTIAWLVEILYEKRRLDPEYIFKLQFEFFTNYPHFRDYNMEFARAVYVDQHNMDPSFDPRARDLFFLAEKDADFFNVFIDLRIKKYKQYFTAPKQTLTDVWAKPEAQLLVYNSLLKISDVKMSSIGMEDFAAVLFIHLKPEFQEPALLVLKKLLTEFRADVTKLNMTWNILRNYLRQYYAQMIQYWLGLNDDMTIFKKMDWTNQYFDYANGIPSQQRIIAYQFVSDAIEGLPDTDRYVAQQAFLQSRIESEQRGAENEIKLIYRGLW